MDNEITSRSERVHPVSADSYVVNGRTGEYVVTVLKSGTHGMPFTCFCTCKHGREAVKHRPTGSTTGCWHIDESYTQSCAEWRLRNHD